MPNDDLAGMPVVPRLPGGFGRGEPAPARMAGATIVAIGSVGGGLAIDYTPRKSKQVMRVVLEMGQSGMSIRYHGARRPATVLKAR